MLTTEIFDFLTDLKQNNNRDWMQENKKRYQSNEKNLKIFYQEILKGLSKTDEISKTKIFRINRDLRFSKDKTPYNTWRSVSFGRKGLRKRGGYYLRIEPNKTRIGGGFFAPESYDLKRIRKEFEMDSDEIKIILDNPKFKKIFGDFNREYSVKTAPRGFDKNHKNIDLIRLKAFFVTHYFTNEEVLQDDFLKKVVDYFEILHPFFDYMSEVLTTDLNGESIL